MAQRISENDRLGRILSRPEFQGMSQFVIPVGGLLGWIMKQLKPVTLERLSQVQSAEEVVAGLNRLGELVNAGVQVRYDLWSDEERARDPTKTDSALLHFPAERKGPFILICPGGGYFMVSSLAEGNPVAVALNDARYSAFVLNYRTGKQNRWPAPMEDLQQALHFIVGHADELNVDVEDYALVGFSAGGHLAASFGTANYGYKRWNLPRPGALLLAYPLTMFEDETMTRGHKLCRDNILGKNPSREQIESVDVVRNADGDFPPTYIMHGQDDPVVAFENGLSLANRLKALDVPCHLNAVPSGGHGFGLGSGTPAQGWLAEAVRFWQANGKG